MTSRKRLPIKSYPFVLPPRETKRKRISTQGAFTKVNNIHVWV